MNTKFTHIIFFFFLSASLCAQDDLTRQEKIDLREADFAYYQGDFGYVEALLSPLYEKKAEDGMVNFQLGRAIWERYADAPKAEGLLRKAVEQGQKEAEFYLGLTLAAQSKFAGAEGAYRRYLNFENKTIPTAEVKRHLVMLDRAKDMLENPVDVEIANLGPSINTAAKEYVPVITADNSHLYFTSRRDDSTGGEQDPNGEFFEDIYTANAAQDGWSHSVNVGAPINSGTHDATVSISPDGSTMIIYRTNAQITGGDLYLTNYKDGKWSNPERLGDQINTQYQEASACLSPDNETLYFSSNRPGGQGGKDIYRVKKLPNNQWSLPLNLGPMINTPYDEDAPFVDADGKLLFFASNGHETMGGYDIFKAQMVGEESFGIPENIGCPINTVKDDLYFCADRGGRIGYYSSDQPNGFGMQDLYKIDFIERKNKLLVLKGIIQDKSGEGVRTTITLINEDTKEVEGIFASSGAQGKYVLVINPMVAYKLVVESNDYQTLTDELYYPFPEGDRFQFEISPYIMKKGL